MAKTWKPSPNQEVFNDDDKNEFGVLKELMMQPTTNILIKTEVGMSITIKGLNGGKVHGTILGFNNFPQKGRIVYFETEVGYYGAIDVITCGLDILSIVKGE